jgi:hypothetical protein
LISAIAPLIAGTLIVGLGGYGKAATIIGLFYILGLIAVPLLPETKGKPLPEADLHEEVPYGKGNVGAVAPAPMQLKRSSPDLSPLPATNDKAIATGANNAQGDRGKCLT